MTRRRPASSLAPTRRPGAKLKSERIQGAAEKASASSPRRRGPGLETVERAGIMRLLAQMPGWSFDEERSSFHAQLRMGPAVEIPLGDGLTVATRLETWVDVQLSEGARQWTKARLEGVRAVNRSFAPAAVKVPPKEPR